MHKKANKTLEIIGREARPAERNTNDNIRKKAQGAELKMKREKGEKVFVLERPVGIKSSLMFVEKT